MMGCSRSNGRYVGLLLLVLVIWATQDLYGKKKPPLHPINLNTATSEQLQEVPGIGPVTAEKILQARKSYGAFKSVDDLQAIKGIGPKRLEKMKKYLTVSKTSQALQNDKPPAHTAAVAKNPPPAKTPAAKPDPASKTPPPASDDEEE